MTEVAFHFNAPDRVAYACRLLRKGVNSGAKIVVTGSPDTLHELDGALWTFSSLDFVPHCQLESERAIVDASPVILATSPGSAPHQEVLLNLGELVPDAFDRFARVIEIVGLGEADRQAARSRWKQYAELGYAMTRYDVAINKSLQ